MRIQVITEREYQSYIDVIDIIEKKDLSEDAKDVKNKEPYIQEMMLSTLGQVVLFGFLPLPYLGWFFTNNIVFSIFM